MEAIIKLLAEKNALLFYAGLTSLVIFAILIIVSFFDHRKIMGINAWIKPIKFFISIAIYCWTMAFYLHFLEDERATAIKWFSWMVILVFSFELSVITWQASRGQLSHFNISTPINSALFSLMGVAIVLLTIWTLITSIWFFKHGVPAGYSEGFWWGIRLGIILFAIFSMEGLVMGKRLQHTVGAPDGGEGLPVVNWSKKHGDLRIAHFVGMHALQLLPFLGYFVFKKPVEIILAAVFYGAFSLWLFIRAIKGKGLGF